MLFVLLVLLLSVVMVFALRVFVVVLLFPGVVGCDGGVNGISVVVVHIR